jgi:hypothetical protein
MNPVFIIAGKLGKVSFQRKMTSWDTPLFRPEMIRVQKGTKALLRIF